MSRSKTNLGEGSVGKLLLSLALPAIVAQLVNVLYNIVDRIFIGRMLNGEVAMAGVGVAFPIIMIISAFSALIGMAGDKHDDQRFVVHQRLRPVTETRGRIVECRQLAGCQLQHLQRRLPCGAL